MAEKPTKFEKWFRKLRRAERVFYRPLFRLKRFGHTAPYDDRAYIFVSNHLSILDVTSFVEVTTNPVHFLAKKDLFEKGLMKKFVTKCQCIPVSRDGTDVKAVMQAMKYLKSGESIAIFPEGTRNKSKEIFLPFKSGAAAISIKTKTPIVPIIQLRKPRFLRRSYVAFGEPLEFTDYYGKRLTEEDVKICDAKLTEAMLGLYNELSDKVNRKKN